MLKNWAVIHRSIVSIDRPSSEASSISPLEAEEETLEVVAVVGGDLGMFFTADSLD